MAMTLVPIGTFARMTHLSIKRLRHYHDNNVLVAARVDPRTGYRYYDVRQAEDARLVATLRSLDMALPRIAQLVRADGSIDSPTTPYAPRSAKPRRSASCSGDQFVSTSTSKCSRSASTPSRAPSGGRRSGSSWSA